MCRRYGNRENGAYHSGFDDRAEHFAIVNAGLLMKTLGDQPHFVTFDGPICLALNTKNPFATHQITCFRLWNKSPSVALQECIKLKIHGCTPFRRFHSSSVTGGFNGGRVSNGKDSSGYWVLDATIGGCFRFGYVVFGVSNHGVRCKVWCGLHRERRWSFREG